MASENLINELFEIIQANCEERLSYDDFEKDLLKNINLPNDEIDRALSIILSQAEVNPNVIGESKGGTFIVSSSFSASVISTIKYENQFIEGKEEFNERISRNEISNGVSAIIIHSNIIDKMIDNYDLLSDSELQMIIDNFDSMTAEQRAEFLEKSAQNLRDQAEKIKDDEMKEVVEKQADNADLASKNAKKSNITDLEKITTIAILDKMYPEIMNVIKTLDNFDELSIEELYEAIKIENEKRTAKISVEVSKVVKEGKNESWEKHKKTYSKEIAFTFAVNRMISFMQERGYLKYNMTLEQFLELSTEEMESLVSEYSGLIEYSRAKDFGNFSSDIEQVSRKKEDATFDATAVLKKLNTYMGDNDALRSKLQNYMGNPNPEILMEDLTEYREHRVLNISDPIKQYIDQIPFALKKAGFPMKDIVSAIGKYANVIKGLELDDEDTEVEIQEKIANMLDSSESTPDEKKAFEILKKLNFKNKIDYLVWDKREDFVVALMESVKNSKLLISPEHAKLNNDFERILEDYFLQNSVDMDITAIDDASKSNDITKLNDESSLIGKNFKSEKKELYNSYFSHDINKDKLNNDNNERENEEDSKDVITKNEGDSKMAEIKSEANFYSPSNSKQSIDLFSQMRTSQYKDMFDNITASLSQQEQKKDDSQQIDPNGNPVPKKKQEDIQTREDEEPEQ